MLVLARITPAPRKFMYQFNDQGKLRDFAEANRILYPATKKEGS
jgi:hypothetical protein